MHSSFQFGRPLNRNALMHVDGMRYDFRKPHRVDILTPRVRFAVFHGNGKVVAYGGRNEHEIEESIQVLMNRLAEVDMGDIQRTPMKVNSVSTSGYLGYHVDLAALARCAEHEDNVTYETEQFPGLRYRLLLPQTNKSINATVYASGKCILMGAKCYDHVLEAFDRLLRITEPYAL